MTKPNSERSRLSDSLWDSVWERLRREGVVIDNPGVNPPLASSCAAIDQWVKNPGATRNVRVIMQRQQGISFGDGN